MSARIELVRALQVNETSGLRALLLADPEPVRRHAIVARTVLGVPCFANRSFPMPLLHRSIGLGTLAEATPRVLDGIVRFFARHGGPARVEVAERVGGAGVARLLERAGFRREEERHHVHVLETAAAPLRPAVPGLRIARPSPRRFGRAVRAGFEVRGALGTLFDRASAAQVAAFPERAVPLIPLVDGELAGSALLWLSPRVGGLYSGSVLPRFRGRGIQRALIAERVRLGLARGRRIFTSQTEGDDASAHNLRGMGFRTLYRSAFFARETS